MALGGKVAVVTGAAMGIGKAMTETLLQNGAKVALLDVNQSEGKTLKEVLDKQYGKTRTIFLTCDVEREEQMKDAFQETVKTFGGIDILCNNAGIFNEATWEKLVSVNFASVIRGTYLALDHMSKKNGGRGGVIVNTASTSGLSPFKMCPVYSATKHGVVGFSRAMALASKASGYGVRINSLCPGPVQTNMLTSLPSNLGPYSHMAEEAAALLLKKEGIVSMSFLTECFLELVTDETKDGEALVVQEHGKEYIPPSLPGLK